MHTAHCSGRLRTYNIRFEDAANMRVNIAGFFFLVCGKIMKWKFYQKYALFISFVTCWWHVGKVINHTNRLIRYPENAGAPQFSTSALRIYTCTFVLMCSFPTCMCPLQSILMTLLVMIQRRLWCRGANIMLLPAERQRAERDDCVGPRKPRRTLFAPQPHATHD